MLAFRGMMAMMLGLGMTGWCGAQNLDIIEGPRDDVIMAGQDTTLTCRVEGDLSTDYLEWREFITSGSGRRIWFSNQEPEDIGEPEKYEILNQFDLKVKNASVQDGGQYGCQLLFNDNPDLRSADLYVFEPAVCESRGEDLQEGDVGVVACTVPFGGTNPPQVEFFRDGRLVEKESYETDTFLVIWANITMSAEDDGMDYECRVRLTEPSYSDSCVTSLRVLYSARNLSVEPYAETYVVGDQLECAAKGNPQPEVRWRQVFPENDVINGSVLTLTPEMMRTEQTWTCSGENTVQGNVTEVAMNITFTVVEGSPSGGHRFTFSCATTMTVLLLVLSSLSQ